MVEMDLAIILYTNGGPMADFNKAYNPTIYMWEKWGLENNPGDYGNITFAGISKKYHPGLKDLWDNIDAAEKARLAVESFYRDLWIKISGDKIHSNEIAAQIFQGYVHCWDKAAKWAQEVCNEEGKDNLIVDGIIGDITVKSINRLSPHIFKNAFYEKQISFYAKRKESAEIALSDLNLGKYNSEEEKQKLIQESRQLMFIQGWINRAKYFAR